MSTPKPTPMRLRSQETAKWAHDTVRSLMDASRDKKELKSHLRKLPAHLQASGLGQTLLFYAGKHKDIAKPFCERLLNSTDIAGAVRTLAEMDAAGYRAKAREALALAGWLKRYAEALIADK